MELVEIRDLDGPNLFLLEPAIKVELALHPSDSAAVSAAAARLTDDDATHRTSARSDASLSIGALLQDAVARLHDVAGVPRPNVVVQALETPGHFALAFGWRHRRFALRLAEAIAERACGRAIDEAALAGELRRLLEPATKDDRPLMVRDVDRTVRAIAVTGTNGKTTTTRLIAHILMRAGLRVGWCSSSGVYIDGEEVISGDYSGPSGARRVLGEPGLDVGVLETARGGILLRGVAYESNDVGVFTNVSADHLDLQGVRTVEGLARVKAVVVRVTQPTGHAVLNADDPLVMGAASDIRALRFLVSQSADNRHVRDHARAGGPALLVADGRLVAWRDGGQEPLFSLAEIPIAYAGRARHMVENVLCAAAACLALGIDAGVVQSGLKTFRNSPDQNLGRLNVVRLHGFTVIVDYAHNEAGLRHLIAFASDYRRLGGRLTTIIGTAGDRTDSSLREIGRIAAAGSDAVVIKGTERYLRGRASAEEMIDLYREGIRLAGKEPAAIAPLELPALIAALETARDGDVVAIMAQEQIPELLAHLAERGGVREGEEDESG
jgi:cyanophycin synthetase